MKEASAPAGAGVRVPLGRARDQNCGRLGRCFLCACVGGRRGGGGCRFNTSATAHCNKGAPRTRKAVCEPRGVAQHVVWYEPHRCCLRLVQAGGLWSGNPRCHTTEGWRFGRGRSGKEKRAAGVACPTGDAARRQGPWQPQRKGAPHGASGPAMAAGGPRGSCHTASAQPPLSGRRSRGQPRHHQPLETPHARAKNKAGLLRSVGGSMCAARAPRATFAVSTPGAS